MFRSLIMQVLMIEHIILKLQHHNVKWIVKCQECTLGKELMKKQHYFDDVVLILLKKSVNCNYRLEEHAGCDLIKLGN
jgi:hypothetical protein